MPRSENQRGARIAGQNVAEGLQQKWFLAVDSASANNHRAGIAPLERCAQAGYYGCRRRRRHIEFQIASNLDFFRIRTNFLKSTGVFCSLGQEEIDLPQD